MAQKGGPVKAMTNANAAFGGYKSAPNTGKGVAAPPGSKRPSTTVKAAPMSKSPQRSAAAASDEKAKARGRGNPDK